MKCTYPSTLGNVVSEYIWLWGSISKILRGIREQTNRQTEATTLYILICRKRSIKKKKKKKERSIVIVTVSQMII